MKKDILFYSGSILRVDPDNSTYKADPLPLSSLFQRPIPDIGMVDPCLRLITPWAVNFSPVEYLFSEDRTDITYNDAVALIIIERKPFQIDNLFMPWHSLFFQLRYGNKDTFEVTSVRFFHTASALSDSEVTLFVPNSPVIDSTTGIVETTSTAVDRFGFNTFVQSVLEDLYGKEELFVRDLQQLVDVLEYDYHIDHTALHYTDVVQAMYPVSEVYAL